MGPPDKTGLKSSILERFHDPLQLRAVLTALVLGLGYVGMYAPLNNDSAEAAARLAEAQRRQALGQDIERLRSQFDLCKKRLTGKTEPHEWIQYTLDGIRAHPVKLNTLDPRPIQDVGPFKAVALRIELEGSYSDLHSFLGWLERNDRLFRVEGISLMPQRQSKGVLVMQLTVLGLMG